MSAFQTRSLIETDFDFFVEALYAAALARNYKSLKSLLECYFDTDLSHYKPKEQAFLFYFLGFYCVHFGKAGNIQNYQEKGKDYLTNAVELFYQNGFYNESISAQIVLGWADHLTGKLENYEAFLLDASDRCHDNTSDAYFSIQVNLLVLYFDNSNFAEAKNLISNILQRGLCENPHISWQFWHNAGRIYRRSGDLQKAFGFLHQAIDIARKFVFKHLLGMSLNSLACCYLDDRSPQLGLNSIEESLDVLKGFDGATAQSLDTKAQILLALGEKNEADLVINKSLFYFRAGESYLEFVDALWNKIKILSALNEKNQIIETFAELSATAFLHLSLNQQRYYFKKFADLVVIPFGQNYDEMVNSARLQIIEPHLVKGVTEAGRSLKVNHQNISRILKKNQKNNRSPRADKKFIRQISYRGVVKVPTSDLIFEDSLSGFFQVEKDYLQTSEDIILLVYQTRKIKDGNFVLMDDSHPFIAQVATEDGHLSFIDFRPDREGSSVGANAKYIGRILGYASAADLTKPTIIFQDIQEIFYESTTIKFR